MVTVCHSPTLNSRLLDFNSTEQSENVYENKGERWKAVGPRGDVVDNKIDTLKNGDVIDNKMS